MSGIKKIRRKTLFKRVLYPLLAVIIVQYCFLVLCIELSGSIEKIREGELASFENRVKTAKSYMDSSIFVRFMDIDDVSGVFESALGSSSANTGKDFGEALEDDELVSNALALSYDTLINTIKRNNATGGFILLETGDGGVKQGISIDVSETRRSGYNNSDVIIKHMMPEVAQKLNLEISSGFTEGFELSEASDASFYQRPFLETAMLRTKISYWSTPFSLQGGGTEVISYSRALSRRDGEPYGVFGIDISTDRLKDILPSGNITSSEGVYMLALVDKKQEMIWPLVTNFPDGQSLWKDGELINITGNTELNNLVEISAVNGCEGRVYADIQYINQAKFNATVSGWRWAVVGVATDGAILSGTWGFRGLLLVSLLISLIFGFVSVLIISGVIVRPISRLVNYIREHKGKVMRGFMQTNIYEIDELSAAIGEMSQSVADYSSKLVQVMGYADIAIGAFEWKRGDKEVFCTGSFFKVFGLEGMDENCNIPIAKMRETLAGVARNKDLTGRFNHYDNESIYRINDENNDCRDDGCLWASLRLFDESDKIFGIAKDITREVREMLKMLYERDYDILTDLLNRRAFDAKFQELFNEPENLKNAALIMLDLDNLKFINDTYGHDCGDNYIKAMSSVLKKLNFPNVLKSRMSGDEFYVFIYGCEDKSEVRYIISCIKTLAGEASVAMPGGSELRVRVSAGVAWYPDDTRDWKMLKKYSDFAMYMSKRTIKGGFCEFSMDDYNREAYLLNKREELNIFIDNEYIVFHFQPIVDAHTGEIYAYEALMRSKLKSLVSPTEILKLAKSQSKLYQIERLTVFKSMEQFFTTEKGTSGKYRMFMNSIASQRLSDLDIEELINKYEKYLSQVVIEITEEEENDFYSTMKKSEMVHSFGGKLALDDFGSGYNGEALLLKIQPDFIKLDITLVRNIHKNIDKQNLMKNIVEYCKARDIKIIAEGVEKLEEMEYLIKHGADYLQGFYVSRPELNPPDVYEESLAQIKRINGADNGESQI